MVLIFGGTTQGRISARVCDSASQPFFYSTRGDGQRVNAANIKQINGAMSSDDIAAFCSKEQIKLIIDASHPFAEELHLNITTAAQRVGIATVRFERLPLSKESLGKGVKLCSSMESAADHIIEKGYQKVLALTGVKSSNILCKVAQRANILLRIMDFEESWQRIEESGFPRDNIVLYGDESDHSLITRVAPDAILIKESGDSGGVPQKIEIAKELGIDLIIVDRPQQQSYNTIVYGEHGLRRAIEKLLPNYFELSTGLTTGSCATAAARVALRAILSGERPQWAEITLPNAEPIMVEVAKIERLGNWARATIIKDAGDDPDITHGAEICADVIVRDGDEGITIDGGEGVGTVTLPGIGLEVGQRAINRVPREMILNNITCELTQQGVKCGVEVVISVPKGAELAKRTFNERLGIIGGVSILGTSGIVHPFSKDAFIESIERHIGVVKALGHKRVVINSGGKSERFLKGHFAELPSELFVQYGNLIGETLKICNRLDISEVTLGVMIGKAVKLAEGYLDTHSKNGVMNLDFIVRTAQEAGYSQHLIDKIRGITTARELWDIAPKGDIALFERLKQQCYSHTRGLLPNGELTILFIDDNGNLL